MLPDQNVVTKHTLPIISSAQNLLCLSFHNPAPAGLFSLALGVCFTQCKSTEQKSAGNPELLALSLEFSAFVSQVQVRASGPKCHKGLYFTQTWDNGVKELCGSQRLESRDSGVNLTASSHDWRGHGSGLVSQRTLRTNSITQLKLM